MTGLLDDYDLGGAIADALGASTRGVDPAVVEHIGRELRPTLEHACDVVADLVASWEACQHDQEPDL